MPSRLVQLPSFRRKPDSNYDGSALLTFSNWIPVFAGMTILFAVFAPVDNTAHAEGTCAEIGRWLEPGDASRVEPDQLYREMARRPIVLLGERHESAEDHRWQLQTLAALYAHQPRMVIGFEMFPRAAQPVLDRWVAGELKDKDFLEAVKWGQVWGYDAALYMPLFHFARANRIAMRALNIERKIIADIGRRGWKNVPEAERGGIGDPAPASAKYRDYLAGIFAQHGGKETADSAREAALAHFIEAQLAWDRAMAEALGSARAAAPEALIVGIIGRGHLEFGYGVPHQLSALGHMGSAVLLTAEVSKKCPGLAAGLADALFGVAADDAIERERPRLRLGIVIERASDGVRVTRVVEDSVAAATGIVVEDTIFMAAGRRVREISDLTDTIGRQAPGTWLPLGVRRAEETLALVAKFPPEGGAKE